MLVKLSDVNLDNVSVQKTKDNTYIRLNRETPELQTEWITLEPFALPSKKYVNEGDKSVSFTIPVTIDNPLYRFFDGLDQYLESKRLVENKTLNKFIKRKDDKLFIKFKLYLNSNIFSGKNKIPEPVNNVLDFYKYLQSGVKARLVISFSKMWNMNSEFGFSAIVNRIHLAEDSESILNKLNFSDD